MRASADRGKNDRHYDLVINGGRVIDPESGLDAQRNLGIVDGKIVAIGITPLSGRKSIDATGLIVSPGFIDLHSHAQQFDSGSLKAMRKRCRPCPKNSRSGMIGRRKADFQPLLM